MDTPSYHFWGQFNLWEARLAYGRVGKRAPLSPSFAHKLTQSIIQTSLQPKRPVAWPAEKAWMPNLQARSRKVSVTVFGPYNTRNAVHRCAAFLRPSAVLAQLPSQRCQQSAVSRQPCRESSSPSFWPRSRASPAPGRVRKPGLGQLP